jgi:hypothetical protein
MNYYLILFFSILILSFLIGFAVLEIVFIMLYFIGFIVSFLGYLRMGFKFSFLKFENARLPLASCNFDSKSLRSLKKGYF